MGSGASKTEWRPSPSQGPADRKFSKSGYETTPLTQAEIDAASKGLTPFQKQVAFSAATERAFTGRTVDGSSHDNKQSGVYVGAVSGLPLFRSDQKYDSGTGWPSFFAPFDDSHVVEVPEGLGFLSRIEIVDARSGAHLGHVFNDGPKPTGKRYCMNAAALRFIPDGEELPKPDKEVNV